MPLHPGDKNNPLKEPVILGNTISFGCGIRPYSPHPAREEGKLQQTEVMVVRRCASKPEGRRAPSCPWEAASIPSFLRA